MPQIDKAQCILRHILVKRHIYINWDENAEYQKRRFM